MTSSNRSIFRITGLLRGESTQRPVTRSFEVFFGLRLNKPLSKQSWGWWFETLFRLLWRHCNGKIGPRLNKQLPCLWFETSWRIVTSLLCTNESWAKWPKFCSHFQMHFCDAKLKFALDSFFLQTEVAFSLALRLSVFPPVSRSSVSVCLLEYGWKAY